VFAGPEFSLGLVEREMIFKALAEAGGHHDKAARMLGISRRTLSRKLKTYRVAGAQETSAA
jgi:DNA-binding NtrC family response regulator